MHTISTAKLRAFHKALHDWYARHGRHDLPWRNTADAYRIYISEVMLQQTQVQTVLSRFYHPFLKRFPDLQALADAPRDDVMKAWEGLGYYSRAANLHEAAKRAAPDMPRTVEELEALPGIGRNTAHAVAAFAYHLPVPVMEANVKRVLCRIFAFEKPKPDALWKAAELLLDSHAPFDYNQAMMDIGAMVCTKRNPDCISCPAAGICKGKAQPEAYPAKAAKKATPVRQAKLVIWQAENGALHLAPREGRFLQGLYGFPEYPLNAETAALHNHAYDLTDAKKLGDVSQTYSHFRMDAEVWLVQANASGEGEGWFSMQEVANLALAGIDHKVIELCRISHVVIED